ncbi:MAG: terminase small subunit [Acidobacteriaceae bacterium]
MNLGRRSDLTPKQVRFVAEYLVDLNGKRAYIAAGYSERTAEVGASKLLRNPKVAAKIAIEQARMAGKLEITAERVLGEIARLAFFDPRKLFNADGSPKRIGEFDDDTAAAVAGLEVYEEFEGRGENRERVGTVKKIKIADKGANLERLGRHLKLFTDKTDLNVDGPLEIVVRHIGAKGKQ